MTGQLKTLVPFGIGLKTGQHLNGLAEKLTKSLMANHNAMKQG